MRAGTWQARALSAMLTGEEGKERVEIECQLTEGDFKDTRFKYYGGFVSDKQIELTMKALRACGFVGDDLSQLGSISGKKIVEAVFGEDTYMGKQQIRCKFLNEPGAVGSMKRLDPAKALSFAERMRARIGGAASTKREPGDDTEEDTFK